MKGAVYCLIFAQNIDCGYTLEPPLAVPTNYVLSKSKKKLYKMGFTGVYVTRTCFRGVPSGRERDTANVEPACT